MSLATIQTAVWHILQQASPDAAMNVTLLFALNAARKDAERRHDWVASETVGYLTVAATTGGSLANTKVSFSSVVQVETATVVGTVTGSGNATVIITSALVTGSPLTVPVAVLNTDTATVVAGKIITALQAVAAVTAHYTVGGTGTTVTLTALVATDNDTLLNISINNGTCTGLTPALTSTDTTAGSTGMPIGSALSVKQIRYLRTRDDTTWIPGKLLNKSTYEELVVNYDRKNNTYWNSDDTPDASEWQDSPFPETRNLILRDGLTLYSLRTSSVNLQLWCYQWLAEYASFAAADDFLITYGADYLTWYAVLFMNKRTVNFVPRNEGSLTEDSIQGMMGAAWESLMLWDAGLKNNQDFILA